MVKRILFSLLAALVISFTISFGFFYVFSAGPISEFAAKLNAIIVLTNFWVAFGLWSFLFFLLFFLPICFMLPKKPTDS